MTKITKVLAVPATGAYYVTDLAALQETPLPLAQQYTATSETPGFRHVREVAEAVSVGLMLGETSSEALADAVVAWGDCVAAAAGVAYAGKSGRLAPRAAVFRTADGLSAIRREVVPVLTGREVTTFREMTAEIEAIRREVRVPAPPGGAPTDEPEGPAEVEIDDEAGLSRRDLLTAPLRLLRPGGSERESRRPQKPTRPRHVTVERPLHSAVRYGVSQALLKAVALTRNVTMAEVIADEWGLPQPGRAVPIHAQSGTARRKNADKMIVRHVASLPHALVEDIPKQLGEDGERLVRYVRWLKERIEELGGPSYRPAIHIDVQGALGRIYDDNLGRILGYLYRLESSVQPLTLRLESPIIMETRAAQIETMKTLRDYVQFRNMAVQIVADEWANTREDIQAFIDAQAADMIQIKMPDLGSISNTVDAVLACKEAGVGAFLGGSCAETDLSARTAVHVALATQPDLIMAKPGMGIDEAVSIVQNEMTRALVLIKTRGSS
jgi:methylaspartate ammonia-lyase